MVLTREKHPLVSVMTFVPGHCAVCGAQPTVKSHIIPRGLAHDLRGDSKHLIGGSIFRPGISLPQSGRWDSKILCAQHEAALTVYDDYGIRFVRAFRAAPFDGRDRVTILPNPIPSHLQLFFLAMIWRKDLSNQVMGETSKLGPYAEKIAASLFEGRLINAPVVLMRSPTSINDQRISIFVEPHRAKFGIWNAWKCDLGWIGGIVILDRRPVSADWQYLDGSRSERVEVVNMDMIDIRRMKLLDPILANMRQSR